MKKIYIILLLLISITLTNLTFVEAATFTDTNVNTFCIDRGDGTYAGETASISKSSQFGNSNLVKVEQYGEITLLSADYALLPDEYITVPKYDVITFSFPILLDTWGDSVTISGSSYSLDLTGFTPEMVINGETYSDSYSFTISDTETRYNRTSFSLGYTRTSTLGLTIPVEGILVGAQIQSSISAYYQNEFGMSSNVTTSMSISGSTTVSNTIGSPYYQDGKTIYVTYGHRTLYQLKVIVFNEIIYSVSSTYKTGTWPFKTTHYVYDDSWADYQAIYQNYQYYNSYYRAHNPFVFTWNSSTNTYDLVPQLRESNRIYIG